MRPKIIQIGVNFPTFSPHYRDSVPGYLNNPSIKKWRRMTNKTNKYEVTPTDRTTDSCLTCSRMSINYSKKRRKIWGGKSYKRSTFRAETALQNDTCFVVLKVSDASKGGGASARGTDRSTRLTQAGKVEVMVHIGRGIELPFQDLEKIWLIDT